RLRDELEREALADEPRLVAHERRVARLLALAALVGDVRAEARRRVLGLRAAEALDRGERISREAELRRDVRDPELDDADTAHFRVVLPRHCRLVGALELVGEER